MELTFRMVWDGAAILKWGCYLEMGLVLMVE